MRQDRSFMVASWIALAAAVLTTLGALLVAAIGVAGLTGRSDYAYRISLVPGTHLLDMRYQPSWEVRAFPEVCPRINLSHPRHDCENVVLRGAHGPRQDPPFLLPGDNIRAVSADLEGRLLFDADPGWNPLVASLYGMTVLSLLVPAFLLSQLWLLLHAVSRDAPFTDQVVRRLRVIGVTLIAWELLEPFLWLFPTPQGLGLRPHRRRCPGGGPGPGVDGARRTAAHADGVRSPVAAAGTGLPPRRTPGTGPEAHGLMAIDIRLDHVLLDRRMTLTELADRVGITVANLSILKTGKARAIRLSTLDAICRELDCQPGDLLTHVPDDASRNARPTSR